jgi:serine/threonine-protein kinase
VELNDQISDRVNQAILHAMELQPDNRPETVEDWLKELGWRTKFTFPSLGNKRLQVLLAAILASGALATKIEPLISALNNGVQLIDRFFSSPSTPNTVRLS